MGIDGSTNVFIFTKSGSFRRKKRVPIGSIRTVRTTDKSERTRYIMLSKPSGKNVIEKNTSSNLSELGALIEELPPELKPRFEKAYRRAVGGMQHRQQVLSFIQGSISQLRLDMKYLIFDLDATRKERDEYRRRLEEIT